MDPSGSNVAPPEDGNTNSSSGAKKKRDAGKVNWFLTLMWPFGINHSKISPLKQWMRAHTIRCVLQLEKGTKTDYQHMQLAITMKNKKRLTWFKHHLAPHVHCEVMRNEEASFDYCSKEDTRIWGPWVYPEPPSVGIDDPMKDLTMRPWQQDIIDIIEGPVHSRHIYWYWEPVGCVGKTVFCKHLIVRYDAQFFQGGSKKDIAYAYKGGQIVLFNFSRDVEDKVSYESIESVKDGLIFSGKYESGVKMFAQPHIVCFANWLPQVERMSLDRWIIRQIPAE